MGELDLSPPQLMVRLLMGFISARAVYTAAKLGLADQIDTTGSSEHELAARLRTDRSGLGRLLRSLTGLGVLRGDNEGRYFLTEIGETLRVDSPSSIRDYAIYVHEFLYELFEHLPDGVRGGKPFVEATLGAPLFTYLQQHRDTAALFHAGLANRGHIEAPAILESYSFGNCKRIADLGGGNGAFLSAVIAAHPGVSGILLDREPAIEAARRGEGGPLPHCELVVGDYFNAVPPGADLYVFKRVLFDHNSEEVIRILRNCRAVMKLDSRIVVIEGLAGALNEPSLAHLMDLTFLLATTGRMRTRQEYTELLRTAGLSLRQCLPTRSDVWVLEAALI
jgi:O-methyltransferase/methyltransferase family protein